MYSAPGSGYGPLFNDRFWPGGYDIRDMYRYITYKADVIADTPQKKQIRMTGVGKSGIYANVKIEKTFTLEKNSSLLKADFAITNGMDNVVPLQKGYWTYGGVQVPEGYNRVVPGLNGVEVSPAFKQLATRDISAGWYGVEAGGRGLAIIVPWERLKEIYYWAGNAYTGTIECKLGIYPIKAGETYTFSMAVAPFDKVGVPDKVNEFASGGFNLASEYTQTPAQLSFKARLTAPGVCDVRMAQRFDIVLTTNYIAGLWSLSGHVMSLNVKSCINELTKQLKKEYDLYVVSSDAWRIIGKGNTAAILEKVSQGAGLIMTEPYSFPAEFSKYLKVVPKNSVTPDAAAWHGDLLGIDRKLFPATRILATLRDINQTALLGRETGKHQIDLDKKYYIYDLLKGPFIGYGDKFSYSYTYAPQGVFVLLPYKAKGLDIKLRPDGAELELLADTRQFADHTFHVELLDGKGNIVPAFNDVLPGRGNKAFYKFRKSLNAAGKWKLQVREILTGMTRTVPLP